MCPTWCQNCWQPSTAFFTLFISYTLCLLCWLFHMLVS
jgi:hypothetical protein